MPRSIVQLPCCPPASEAIWVGMPPDDEDDKTLADRSYTVGDASLANVGAGVVVFGRYRLEKEIGRGGMGVVWLAHDERVEIPVALKFLPDMVARDAECVDELKRELRRGLTLTHPGIVRVFSFEQDEHAAAISMEYVDGTTLGALRLKQPSVCFDWDELLPWMEQLCAALDYAHEEAKIVHRDLKPRNLMLTAKNRLKVADFGVATSISDTMSRAAIRKDGSGTPPYMSPQQAFGENPTPADDIYSLGATVYELLTGRPPFYQGNILAQAQQRVPPSMSERRDVLKVLGKKPIPEYWEKTVAACLAKQVEDRPQRASEVLEEFRGLRQPPAGGAVPTGPINPAVTLSTAGDAPLARNRGASGEHDTALATAAPSSLSRRTTARTLKRRGNPGLAAAALLSLLLVGGAAWWWWAQQKPYLSDFTAAGKPEEPASSIPEPKAAPIVETPPVPAESVQAEQAAALAADGEAAAAGRIPRAGAPWTNGLYMRFVPVPGIAPLVCAHEVRVADYHAFAVAMKRALIPTEFFQGDNHPVVNVSWADAQAFCEWLTKTENAEGMLGSRQRYRLLTDAEWSTAAGVDAEQGATPAEKNLKVEGIFPWGMGWPPPQGASNLAGEGETSQGAESELLGYKDGFSHTAQVGSFKANAFGLHDLAGNASEWVQDWFNEQREERTIRGSAFVHRSETEALSSFRAHMKPSETADYLGFRICIDLGPKPSAEIPARPAVPQ